MATTDEHEPLTSSTSDGIPGQDASLDEDEVRENEYESDEDEDEDDDSSSLLQDLSEGWKQHVFAIVVAMVATLIAYAYQRQARLQAVNSSSMLKVEKHAHLHRYRRCANVTFCGGPEDMNKEFMVGSDKLQLFDFSLSKEWLGAMKLHFAADTLQDDDYSVVLKDDTIMSVSGELGCLLRIEKDSTSSKVKGLTYYWPSPKIQSMYGQQVEPKKFSVLDKSSELQAAVLTFTGFAAKFVNLSPEPLLLFWDGNSNMERRLVGEIPPFESLGTATTPGQGFSVSPIYDSSHAFDRWVLTIDDALVFYEPDSLNLNTLSKEHLYLYQMQKLNQEFANHYLIHAKRTWLAHFPRPFPVHHMWPASPFGQAHTVETDDENIGHLRLTVASVTPRVFTIPNFLTHDECDQLIHLAVTQGLNKSTVYAGLSSRLRDASTRSSSNTWLQRDYNALTDSIYRRAAQVLRINESLLQPHGTGDDNHEAHSHSIAESLQIVRYRAGEEYTAHHDFVHPSQRHRLQPTRFATLLLYLNDDFTGGITTFPRATNAHYHQGIEIEPTKGSAALFYNVLPDGNVDDKSQHSSSPVLEGDKFLANLWIWEPLIN